MKLMAAAGWGGEVSRGRGDRWTACLLVCRPGFLMLPWNGRSAGPRAFVGKYRRHGRPLLRMIAAKLIRHYCIVARSARSRDALGYIVLFPVVPMSRTVQCSAVQCSAVQCSAVPGLADPGILLERHFLFIFITVFPQSL